MTLSAAALTSISADFAARENNDIVCRDAQEYKQFTEASIDEIFTLENSCWANDDRTVY